MKTPWSKNLSQQIPVPHTLGHRTSRAWHDQLMRDLNPSDLLELCLMCLLQEWSKPFYLSLERLDRPDEIPLHSPASQPALSVPKVQQERLTQQEHSKGHTHIPNLPEHLTEGEEFTAPKGNSFCFSFLGQALATRRTYTCRSRTDTTQLMSNKSIMTFHWPGPESTCSIPQEGLTLNTVGFSWWKL